MYSPPRSPLRTASGNTENELPVLLLPHKYLGSHIGDIHMREKKELLHTIGFLNLYMNYLGIKEDYSESVPLTASPSDLKDDLQKRADYIESNVEPDRNTFGKVSGDHIKYLLTREGEEFYFSEHDAEGEEFCFSEDDAEIELKSNLTSSKKKKIGTLEDLSEGKDYVYALSSNYDAVLPPTHDHKPFVNYEPPIAKTLDDVTEEDGTLPQGAQEELQDILETRRDKNMLSPSEEPKSTETSGAA